MAVLVSAVFLQRFSLPFGATRLTFDFAAIVLILSYQFLCGKLLVQYDRLLWFLSLVLANTSSLLLNFENSKLTAYFLSLALNSLLMLSRPSTSDQYNRMLQAFQLLVIFLSCLGVVQFVLQFVIDGTALMNFYGIVPEFLLSEGVLSEPRNFGGIIKSNAIFFHEPSIYSQFTALGILIEVLEFRRPRYLVVIALGFLVAYSGTGLVLLLLFLPFASLTHDKAGFSVLLVAMFALGLAATGIIELSVFTSRVGEFEEPGSSASIRFVAPMWATAEHFHTASLQALLVGDGPGAAKMSLSRRGSGCFMNMG